MRSVRSAQIGEEYVIRSQRTEQVGPTQIGANAKAAVREVFEYWTGEQWDLQIGKALKFDSEQVLMDYMRTRKARLEAP